MLKRSGMCAALLVAATAYAQDAPPPAKQVHVGDSRLSFYGFLRVDAIFDDSKPDNSQTPTFIQAESGAGEDVETLTLHPRLSRLGMNFAGPAVASLGNAQVTGTLEVDFQNGGRESRAIPRYRQAHLKLAWAESSLLIGQTSDLISPLFPSVNSDTLMWNAGNLGDRRVQIRYAWEPKREGVATSLAGALGLTGAVDSEDLDADGVRDGEAAAVPNAQVRFGLAIPIQTRNITLGLWGHVAQQKVATPVGGESRFHGNSLGIDYQVPLTSRLVWKGELWSGEDLSDFRGGSGQSINRSTGVEIASQGGWTEVSLDASARYTVGAGLTVDNPDDDDVPANSRTKNGAWYLVNRWKFGKTIHIGVDYLHWTTEFAGRPDGVDNRFNAYAIYNF